MSVDDRQRCETGFSYDVSPQESLSEAVVTAVSTASGTEPAPDTSPGAGGGLDPLYSVIDPEALDSLFHHADSGGAAGRVTFRYHGYAVTVHSEGRISLAPSAGRAAD